MPHRIELCHLCTERCHSSKKAVKLDNPDSGMRGMVNPTGLPFVKNDEICRGFLASVIGPGSNRFVRGTGCRPSGGAWELKSVKTTTKPG